MPPGIAARLFNFCISYSQGHQIMLTICRWRWAKTGVNTHGSQKTATGAEVMRLFLSKDDTSQMEGKSFCSHMNILLLGFGSLQSGKKGTPPGELKYKIQGGYTFMGLERLQCLQKCLHSDLVTKLLKMMCFFMIFPVIRVFRSKKLKSVECSCHFKLNSVQLFQKSLNQKKGPYIA